MWNEWKQRKNKVKRDTVAKKGSEIELVKNEVWVDNGSGAFSLVSRIWGAQIEETIQNTPIKGGCFSNKNGSITIDKRCGEYLGLGEGASEKHCFLRLC